MFTGYPRDKFSFHSSCDLLFQDSNHNKNIYGLKLFFDLYTEYYSVVVRVMLTQYYGLSEGKMIKRLIIRQPQHLKWFTSGGSVNMIMSV